MSRMSEMSQARQDYCNENYGPGDIPDPEPFYGAQCPSYPDCKGGCGLGCTHEIETRKGAKPLAKDSQPRVIDFDDGEISVRFDGKELRGWSYANDEERLTKMLCAREYVEGWCDGREARGS